MLTEAQAKYLRKVRDSEPESPSDDEWAIADIVAWNGLIEPVCTGNIILGYALTDAGRRALEEWEKEHGR